MSNFSKRKTTFQRLKPGMSVFWEEKIVKITRLRKVEITESGLIYQFEIDRADKTLTGLGSKKITVIK